MNLQKCKKVIYSSIVALLLILNFSGCAKEQQEYYGFNDYVEIKKNEEEKEEKVVKNSTIKTLAKYWLISKILTPNNSYSSSGSSISINTTPKTNNKSSILNSKTKTTNTTKVKKTPATTKPIKVPSKIRTIKKRRK